MVDVKYVARYTECRNRQKVLIRRQWAASQGAHLLGTHGGQPWRRHGGHWGHADLSCHLVHVAHPTCVGRHGYIDVHIVIVHAGVCLLPKVWWGLLWKHARTQGKDENVKSCRANRQAVLPAGFSGSFFIYFRMSKSKQKESRVGQPAGVESEMVRGSAQGSCRGDHAPLLFLTSLGRSRDLVSTFTSARNKLFIWLLLLHALIKDGF